MTHPVCLESCLDIIHMTFDRFQIQTDLGTIQLPGKIYGPSAYLKKKLSLILKNEKPLKDSKNLTISKNHSSIINFVEEDIFSASLTFATFKILVFNAPKRMIYIFLTKKIVFKLLSRPSEFTN